jgi:hypothetical protein
MLQVERSRDRIPMRWIFFGRAIAQAVSRWLPTAAARIQIRVWSSRICGEQSGGGADFLRVQQNWLTFERTRRRNKFL